MGLDMPVMTIRWTCVGSSKRESSMTIPGCLSGLLQSAHHISKRCKSCWRLLSRWQRELSKVSVKPGRRCSKVDGAWQMDVRSCFRNKSLKMSASTEFELSRTRRLWHSAETSLLWSAGRTCPWQQGCSSSNDKHVNVLRAGEAKLIIDSTST